MMVGETGTPGDEAGSGVEPPIELRVRRALGLLERLAPAIGSRWAVELWCTPPAVEMSLRRGVQRADGHATDLAPPSADDHPRRESTEEAHDEESPCALPLSSRNPRCGEAAQCCGGRDRHKQEDVGHLRDPITVVTLRESPVIVRDQSEHQSLAAVTVQTRDDEARGRFGPLSAVGATFGLDRVDDRPHDRVGSRRGDAFVDAIRE